MSTFVSWLQYFEKRNQKIMSHLLRFCFALHCSLWMHLGLQKFPMGGHSLTGRAHFQWLDSDTTIYRLLSAVLSTWWAVAWKDMPPSGKPTIHSLSYLVSSAIVAARYTFPASTLTGHPTSNPYWFMLSISDPFSIVFEWWWSSIYPARDKPNHSFLNSIQKAGNTNADPIGHNTPLLLE